MSGGKLAARLTDVVLVVAALVVVILVVRREVIGRAHVTGIAPPRYVENWQRFFDEGHRMGSASALVKVVEFGDFPCPACAHMHAQVRRLLREYPEELAVVYRHVPLPIHPAAVMAALAAECAADQGMFESFSDVLFAEQQWIGVRDWEDFAKEAGVGDSAEFERCVRDKDFVDRVRTDLKVARELGIVATPTFLVDGVLVSGLSSAQLKERVREAVETARRNNTRNNMMR